MVTTQLTAPDISCEHCVATVKKTAGHFPGVQSVEADAETKIITLTYDPAQVDLKTVEDALAEEGYPVQK
ncbi:MAG: heavy-metal-associated domain-containing protein [Thermomicrobia bacterium]|nr:heavy-metal-associated domain-containing protein [Thermomicrobia bacterium]